MSFFSDITPLTNEVKEFNKNQQKIIALLEEIRDSLKNEYSQQNKLLKDLLKNEK
jgi:hypothetical protein